MLDKSQYSRFKTTNVVTHKGALTYGAWNRPSWLIQRPNDNQIGKHVVLPSQEGRPGIIARSIYGSQYLYWVLLAFNDVQNPMGWPKAGVVIEYPIPELVLPTL